MRTAVQVRAMMSTMRESTDSGRGLPKKRVARLPRATTRGCYDLRTGRPLRRRITYRLYPRRFFDETAGESEMAVVVHGLRNDERGAVEKIRMVKQALQALGYRHPVVGFSYDSNVRGAHIKRFERQALITGRRIAESNGRHLAEFLVWSKKRNGSRKIRLLGHSLGSEVICSAVMHLACTGKKDTEGVIESAYLFGASLPSDFQKDQGILDAIDRTIRRSITNYYAPTDEVLSEACRSGSGIDVPLGLRGASPGRRSSKYRQKKVEPENHRFASYMDTLRSFP